MIKPDKNVVQWVYASTNKKELAERYDVWAENYDRDLDEDFGWLGPSVAVETAIKYLSPEARILDAGAGTGQVGKLLAERGFGQLVAMDLSQGMLDESRKKNAYIEFHQMVMGEALSFPTDSFDGVISVGVLTVGHAPASSLDELVRVTKPAGHVIFTLRPDVYEGSGFKQKQTALEKAKLWTLVEVTEPSPVLPKGEPDVCHQVWVYQVA